MNGKQHSTWRSNSAKALRIGFLVLVIIFSQTRDQIQLANIQDQVRPYTMGVQFNYITWTLHALWDKFSAASMGWQRIIPQNQVAQITQENLQLQNQLNTLEQQISDYYGNPNGEIGADQFKQIQSAYSDLKHQQALLEPVYENLLAEQIRTILNENKLTLGNQAIPPVLFRDTDLPYALILSPRDHIEQIANISLLPDLTLEEMINLENNIETQLDVSALVVPIGGVGTYPTMIMRTTNFSYTAEVIQHEWTHNFLTLRPLGVNYDTTPELRTINETTASIAGKELGNDLLARYYPQFLPEPVVEQATESDQITVEEPVFDYRAEMHTTRVNVDQFLLEGKIDQAEAYLEIRRLFFWENGYRIRKLNQAYYAFYGAYADQPGGAAGDDPVGEAVRNLRQRKTTLADFLKTIAQVTNYEELKLLVNP